MPQTSQGDIFEASTRVQLAIVFGHVGFNEMRQRWDSFARGQFQLRNTRDPFTEPKGNPVEWSRAKWLWFVPEKENHGMTEAQLTETLDSALAWASQNQIASVATNGIADTDHGQNTAANRRSDENRAAWLKGYATRAEQKYKVAIELISLNDVFVRDNK
jgi:hypothetical protein